MSLFYITSFDMFDTLTINISMYCAVSCVHISLSTELLLFFNVCCYLYCNSHSPHHLNILGIQRRRLIPAPLPDTSSLGMKAGATGQWVDLPPISGPLKEPFEIKVYEIDDVERLQRRRQEQPTEVSK